ncbi:MAG: membrane dipeptidase [Deltaproteobacteria bacterium]|nr:membrane dipeptidase [Deltaproteobacteria bacterium]
MEAAEMHDKFIIVEGHRDVYELLYRRSLAEENPLRNAIAPRLIRDGVNVCVYAICGDSYAHSQNTGRYLETAFENIDIFLEEMAQSDGMISLIRTKADVPDRVRPGKISFLLHFEGGKPLNGDLAHLRNFHRLGLRSIQLTWNRRDELGDGVWEERTQGGLTRFGVAAIKELNRLNMVIDLAHLTRAGFYDALEATGGPVIVSHANANSVYKSPRGLDDEQIKAIAARKGLVGILAIGRNVKAGGADVEDLADHLTYMADLAGIDFVGLGLDFTKYDGPRPLEDRPDRRPTETPLIKRFDEVEDLYNLVEVLQKRGFKEADIAQILGENYLRVLRQIL